MNSVLRGQRPRGGVLDRQRAADGVIVAERYLPVKSLPGVSLMARARRL